MPADVQHADYLSYLLRLWRVNDALVEETNGAEKALWRASLESARTGERWGFGNLEELFDYLRAQASTSGPPKPPKEKKGEK